MNSSKKIVDFLDISPCVRYIHHLPNANPSNYSLPWRFIYDYEFLFIADGYLTVLTENENYTLEANDIHIMHPFVWHRRLIPDNKTCDYYSIHFDFVSLGPENDFSPEDVYISYCNKNLLNAPINQNLLQRPLCVLGSMDLPKKMMINNPIAYVEILNEILDAYKNKYFAYEIDIKTGMLRLLKQILNDTRIQIMQKINSKIYDLSAITYYVINNYHTHINFDTICHVYGFSYSNFRKLFKEKSGKSPNEFLMELRINKAIELLYEQKYTVSEIADMVGYQDSGYFSRIFKQKKGCSPSDYVRKQESLI